MESKKMSYAERLRNYEQEKRQLASGDWSASEYEEIIKRLAQKWRI